MRFGGLQMTIKKDDKGGEYIHYEKDEYEIQDYGVDDNHRALLGVMLMVNERIETMNELLFRLLKRLE